VVPGLQQSFSHAFGPGLVEQRKQAFQAQRVKKAALVPSLPAGKCLMFLFPLVSEISLSSCHPFPGVPNSCHPPVLPVPPV
jgi:hypothetical protein